MFTETEEERVQMGLSKKKKIIIGVVGAVVVLVGVKLVLGGGNAQPAGPMVATALASKQDVEETLKLKSVLEGTESTEVVSRLHNEVVQLMVQEGDKVKKGQLLATLDTSDIAQKLSLAQGNLTLLELQQQETLTERQRNYDAAKKEYEDKKALFDIDAVSQDEVDEAKKVLDAISAEGGVAVLTAAEKQTIANTKQQIKTQSEELNDCQIRSMINGTVTRVNTKVGRFADETEDEKPMFVIENIDQLQLEVLVSENDIARVSPGQKVKIEADILEGEEVEGVVTRISPTGEQKDPSSSERVIPVYIDVTGTNEKLIAGIGVKATILIDSAIGALTVPYEAVIEREDGTSAVYVVTEENTIQIVPVTLGLETDLLIEIKGGGIEEGQKVVLNPSLAMTEGATVIVQ